MQTATLQHVQLQPASPHTDLNVAAELGQLAPLLRVVFGAHGTSCVVTHGRDGAHSAGSRHDEGYCLDIRIWGLQFGEQVTGTREWWRSLHRWCAQLTAALVKEVGPYVFLVLEKNHIHLEWAGPGQVPNIVGFSPGRHFYATAGVRALLG